MRKAGWLGVGGVEFDGKTLSMIIDEQFDGHKIKSAELEWSSV
jgi:hypothetical protein